MTHQPGITTEASGRKVAALFDSSHRAREVANRLCGTLQLGQAQVRVISPGDRHIGRQLEPEDKGIFRTMLRAHALLGALGAVVGALAFGVLWWMGVGMVVHAAPAAAFALVVFGTLGGLMLGGLVTLRPDHDAYINRVQEALGERRHAVVVHALSHEQAKAAREQLQAVGGEVVSTLGS